MKFTPINQFFYFDAEEALVELKEGETLDYKQFTPKDSRYDHQIGIFGIALHQTLISNNYFLIGAGAIGCEMLKNWALMGVASDSKSGGKITVTDMDVIETSNLSRQFLFRTKDVGQLKSTTAAAAGMCLYVRVDVCMCGCVLCV
jgi:ubiquitin-activating enzyme E1